jgi:hypothetical protein
MIMYLGAFLFLLFFVMLAPQSRAYLGALAAGVSTFMTVWAPFSYMLLMIIFGTICAGMYMIHSWPKRVDPENPMAKYRREAEATMEDD